MQVHMSMQMNTAFWLCGHLSIWARRNIKCQKHREPQRGRFDCRPYRAYLKQRLRHALKLRFCPIFWLTLVSWITLPNSPQKSQARSFIFLLTKYYLKITTAFFFLSFSEVVSKVQLKLNVTPVRRTDTSTTTKSLLAAAVHSSWLWLRTDWEFASVFALTSWTCSLRGLCILSADVYSSGLESMMMWWRLTSSSRWEQLSAMSSVVFIEVTTLRDHLSSIN